MVLYIKHYSKDPLFHFIILSFTFRIRQHTCKSKTNFSTLYGLCETWKQKLQWANFFILSAPKSYMPYRDDSFASELGVSKSLLEPPLGNLVVVKNDRGRKINSCRLCTRMLCRNIMNLVAQSSLISSPISFLHVKFSSTSFYAWFCRKVLLLKSSRAENTTTHSNVRRWILPKQWNKP